MKETILKVLTADMMSPTSRTPIKYEFGKQYFCKDFDNNPETDCSNGFYATNVEGLPYTFKAVDNHRVFEVEMSGRNVNYNIYKRRWSRIKLIRELSYDEVKQMAYDHRKICGYHLDEVLFPINPKDIINDVSNADWSNLDRFANKDKSARYAAWYAARYAAWHATCGDAWDAARYAAWHATCGDAWDAAWAYLLSIFPCFVKTTDNNILKVIEAGGQLWRRGFLPIQIKGEWTLLSAHNNEILERR